MRKFAIVMALLPAVLGAFSAESAAQDPYPDRPITLVVPYRPGGSSDLTGRIIAEKLEALLGQPIVVDNKGGSGIVGAAAVANAAPDGYTLGYLDSDLWAIRPNVDDLPYDIFTDLVPVAFMVTSFTGLTARNDLPFDTLGELVEYAKQNPGTLTHASAGQGGYSHLLGEALKLSAGIDMVHVPYQGSAPALQDQLGGRVDLVFDSRPVERVSSGQVKGIAIMSRNSVAGLPDVPTIFETYPDFPIGDSGWGIFVPAGTPESVITKLEAALKQIHEDPTYTARMSELGFGTSWIATSEFSAKMTKEKEDYGKILDKIQLN
jgi:tripartite-type tricarboxylate transporter receptor subunit TctC